LTITERMTAAIAYLRERQPRRGPKAFYLVEADWAEFMATDPPTVTVPWANNPRIMRDDPAFEGVPVRQTDGKQSRLYNDAGVARTLVSTK